MAEGAGIGQAGILGQGQQLFLLECGLHGSWAVVHRQVVPTKNPASGGHEVVCDGSTFEIDGEDGPAGESAKASQQLKNLVVRKVMQEQRTEDEVKTPQGEGEPKCIPNHLGIRREGKMQLPVVKGCDCGAWIASPHSHPHVARGGSDVQHGETVLGAGELPNHLSQDPVPAKYLVDSHQIAEIFASLAGRGVIQLFRDNDSLPVNHPLHDKMLRDAGLAWVANEKPETRN